MKKSLLFVPLLLSLTCNAQTLTQSTHAPAIGDAFGIYQCDSTNITPGSSGAGSVWNYSSLNIHTSTLINYATTTSTNTTYNPADVAVKAAVGNNASYYKSSSSDLKLYGAVRFFYNTVATFIYSSPAVVAVYPMSLNSSTTSIISGTVNAGFALPFTGNCSVLADATGTLVLPGRTFTNIIRVVTSQTLNVGSGYAQGYLFNYDYYYPGFLKSPIFSILSGTVNSSAVNTNQTVVYALKDYTTVGVNEHQQQSIGLTMFPNPASTIIHFSTESPEAVKIIAYDVSGKVMATEPFVEGQATINLSQLSSGIYMYSVMDKHHQTLATGKFNVAK